MSMTFNQENAHVEGLRGIIGMNLCMNLNFHYPVVLIMQRVSRMFDGKYFMHGVLI